MDFKYFIWCVNSFICIHKTFHSISVGTKQWVEKIKLIEKNIISFYCHVELFSLPVT